MPQNVWDSLYWVMFNPLNKYLLIISMSDNDQTVEIKINKAQSYLYSERNLYSAGGENS